MESGNFIGNYRKAEGFETEVPADKLSKLCIVNQIRTFWLANGLCLLQSCTSFVASVVYTITYLRYRIRTSEVISICASQHKCTINAYILVLALTCDATSDRVHCGHQQQEATSGQCDELECCWDDSDPNTPCYQGRSKYRYQYIYHWYSGAVCLLHSVNFRLCKTYNQHQFPLLLSFTRVYPRPVE